MNKDYSSELNKGKFQKLDNKLNNIFDSSWQEYTNLETSIKELAGMIYKNHIHEDYQESFKYVLSNLCQTAVHQLDQLQDLGRILYDGSLYHIFFELCHVKKGELLNIYHDMTTKGNSK